MRKRILPVFLALVFADFSYSQINDWENPELVSLNSEPAHAWFIPYPNSPTALQKKTFSPFTRSLDGEWKFNLAENPSKRPKDFFKDDFDISTWKNIKVPANWQVEGFDRFIFTDVEYPIVPNPPFVPADYNPVGSYKRNFVLPAEWTGKNVFIRFGAVNSFFYLWINGKYVGLSKDSKTPAEFNITPYLRQGNNSVSVQVFRFSDGTYLEGQDMWKLSGIERSVLLIARPKFCINDFFVKAGLANNYRDGVFELDLSFRGNNRTRITDRVEVNLLDDSRAMKAVYRTEQKVSDSGIMKFSFQLPNIRRWNAESPELYTLLILHKDKSGKTIEAIVHKIGFRSLELKNGLFLVNGVPVKIKGVNRHEHDMYNGKVITIESMVEDIRLMKLYNINAVRCSHYPNREEWYELCDRYGIYVIDEANIECDGMDFHPLKTLSDKPQWKAAYLDRTKRMFERDKNFTCIIGWSLGNESRFGENFIATYRFLKSRDNTRPVQYEEAKTNEFTDIYVPMYKSIPVWEQYVRTSKDRPLILCEYAHMMGNSGGNLKDDWDLFYKYPQLQGGFIWDFSDQTFKRRDKNKRDIWAYGRDMGNVGATSDTSFCADGLFAADRTPHPQAFELRKVYQNIYFELADTSANFLRITNRFDFTDLLQFNFRWFIKSEGKLIAEGKLESPDLGPHESKQYPLNLPAFNKIAGAKYFLTVEARTKQPTELIPQAYTIATEQFELPVLPAPAVKKTESYPALTKTEDAKELKISNSIFGVCFDKNKGWLNAFVINNKSLLKGSLLPHFWRTPTDNDIGNSMQIRCAPWKNAIDHAILDSMNAEWIAEGLMQVKTVHRLPSVDARYISNYTINGSGEVEVQVKLIAGKSEMPELPRFGMRVLLDDDFDRVTWFGRGPFDNYWDRNYAAHVDVYSMQADSLFHPYARAQESGYRTDIRWMSLLNRQGWGLLAEGKPLISAGVLHFNMDRLEFDRHAPENNHGGSMLNEDLIWWNIDYKQMGVGGDNSWGARTHSKYTLPYGNYEYSFTLRAKTTDTITP